MMKALIVFSMVILAIAPSVAAKGAPQPKGDAKAAAPKAAAKAEKK